MLTLSRMLMAMACVALAPRVCAQSLDLSIVGTILPGACSAELGGGGVIDLGTVLAEKLDPVEETSLAPVLVPLTVTCQVPVLFAFKGADNTGDSASVVTRYGLGLTADGEKIGGAVIRFRDPTSDGAPVYYTRSEDGGQEWEVSGNTGTTWLGKASINGFAATEGSVGGPDHLSSLQTQLEIRTYIQPTSALTIDGNVPINGRVTIDLIYL